MSQILTRTNSMESHSGDVNHYFRKGAVVEISSNDDGFRGSWYTGTILRPPANVKKATAKVLVEYNNLMEDRGGKRRLKEELELLQLRPPPPVEERRSFKVNEDVDAYYNEGWWEGIITEKAGEDEFLVFFRGTREQLPFKSSELRLHREWVYGKWVPPLEEEGGVDGAARDEERLSSAEVKPERESIEDYFSPGALVEVSSDEDGFKDAWFAATVVKKLEVEKYLIQYQSFMSDDDDTKLLTEEVDSNHIRPCPPDVKVVERFKEQQEVDALYNDGWWVGSIKKVLKDNSYHVYFKTTREKLKFKHSDLRLHQDWVNGRWVITS